MLLREALTPPGTLARGAPTTFGEVFDASRRDTEASWLTWSRTEGLIEAYDRRIDAVLAATGQRLDNPFRAVPSEDDYLQIGEEAKRTGRPVDRTDWLRRRFMASLARISEGRPELASQIRPWVDPEQDYFEERRRAEARNVDVQARASGLTALGGSLAGGLVASGKDPLTWLSLPIGLSANVGRSLLWNVARQAAVGAGMQAAQEPWLQAWRQEAGQEAGLGSALLDVGSAGLLTGGLDLAFRAPVRLGKHMLGLPRQPAAPSSPVSQALDTAAQRLPADSPVRRAWEGDPQALAEIVRAAPGALTPEERGALGHLETYLATERPPGVQPAEHLQRLANALRAVEEPLDLASVARPSPPEAMAALRAYHGSRHKFDRFDMSAMGKGEGAQAFGPGLYFTESRAIGEHYRNAGARDGEPIISVVEAKTSDALTTEFDKHTVDNAFARMHALASDYSVYLDTKFKLGDEAAVIADWFSYLTNAVKDRVNQLLKHLRYREAVAASSELVEMQRKIDELTATVADYKRASYHWNGQPGEKIDQVAMNETFSQLVSIKEKWDAATKQIVDHISVSEDELNAAMNGDFGVYKNLDLRNYARLETEQSVVRAYNVVAKLIADNRIQAEIPDRGTVYEVNLHTQDERLIHLDKPANEQSPLVQAALRQYFGDKLIPALQPGKPKSTLRKLLELVLGMPERRLYPDRPMNLYVGIMNDDGENFRKSMRNLGVDGIKYLDGMSRQAGEGGYNYVIFDDALISIERKMALRKAAEQGAMLASGAYRDLLAPDRLRRVMTDIDRIVRRLPEDVRVRLEPALQLEGRPSDGIWDPRARLISLALNAEDPAAILRHEEVHALRALGLFGDDEWRVLQREAARLGYVDGPRDSLGGRSVLEAYHDYFARTRPGDADRQMEGVLEEAVAHMLADHKAGVRHGGLVDRIIAQVMRILRRIARKLAGKHQITRLDDLFEAIDSGEVGRRRPGFAAGERDMLASIQPLDRDIGAGASGMTRELRLERARQLGFDTVPWFHGTRSSFTQFRPSASGVDGPGVYLTRDPAIADRYARTAGFFGKPRTLELVVRGKLGPSRQFDALVAEYQRKGLSLQAAHTQSRQKWQREGFAGITGQTSEGGVQAVVWDPANIRSVDAAFDEARLASAHLMAALRPDDEAAAEHQAATASGEAGRAMAVTPEQAAQIGRAYDAAVETAWADYRAAVAKIGEQETAELEASWQAYQAHRDPARKVADDQAARAATKEAKAQAASLRDQKVAEARDKMLKERFPFFRTGAELKKQLETDYGLDADEAAEIGDRFDDLREGQDEETARATLAHELEAEAEHRRRVAVLQMQAMRRHLGGIYRHRNAAGEADVAGYMLGVLEHHGLVGGAVESSVEGRRKVILGRSHARMEALLHEFRKTAFTGRRLHAARLENVVRELFGERSGDEAAAGLARAWSEEAERLRERANAAGMAIAHRNDWGLPQWHDPRALRNAGFERWARYIAPRLALDRMTHPLSGDPVRASELPRVLRHVFDSIVMDGWNTRQPSTAPQGRGALWRQRADHRFLVFRSAVDWLEYQRSFGQGGRYGPFASMMGHIKGMARDIAAMEVLGPNPEAALVWMQQVVQQEAARRLAGQAAQVPLRSPATGLAVAADAYASRAIQRSQEMWAHIRGSATTPVGSAGSATLAALRDLATAASLGGAMLSSISDVGFQAMARKFAGIVEAPLQQTPGWTSVQVISDMVDFLRPRHRREAVRAGLIMESAVNVMHDQARWVGELSSGEWVRYLGDRVLTLSGLTAWTEAGRHAFGLEFMGAMQDFAVRHDWNGLSERFRRTLERYGFREAEWAAIREHVQGLPDEHFLRPEALDAIDPRLADRYLEMVLMETEYAVPSGTVAGRSLVIGENRPGTLTGELLRAGAQFKNFGVTVTLLQSTRMMQELAAGRPVVVARYAAALLVTSALFGMASLQLKALSKGEDPRDMSDPKLWGQAVLQSGGLGIYGDFLFSDINRVGGGLSTTLAGPLAGRIQNLWNLTGGNVVQIVNGDEAKLSQEAVQFLRQNTPGSSLWYLRLAWERIVMDELQKMADPDAHRAFRRRVQEHEKQFGNRYWWAPGTARPQRTPDAGAAFGG